MTKLAQKRPAPVKSVVSVVKDRAELWYAEPRLLGTVVYRANAWWTEDGLRFVSTRDALDTLVRLAEAARGALPAAREALPEPTAVTTSALPRRRATDGAAQAARPSTPRLEVRDPFVRELLTYLATHPEIKPLLK